MPRAWRPAPMTRASSCSWAHGTRTRSSFEMNVAPWPRSAARSIRAIRGVGATGIRLAHGRTGYESRGRKQSRDRRSRPVTSAFMSERPDVPAHRYDGRVADEIETRWQAKWDADGTYYAPNPTGPLADGFDRMR